MTRAPPVESPQPLVWESCAKSGGGWSRGSALLPDAPTAAERWRAEALVRRASARELATAARRWWRDAASDDARQLLPTAEALVRLRAPGTSEHRAIVDALAEQPHDQPSVALLATLDRARAFAVTADSSVVSATARAALRRYPTPAAMIDDLARRGLVERGVRSAALVGVFDALDRASRLVRVDVEADANPLHDIVKRLIAISRPALDGVEFSVALRSFELRRGDRCATARLAAPLGWHDLQAVLDALNDAIARTGAPGRLVVLDGGQVFPIAYGPPEAFAALATEGLLPPAQRIPRDFAARMEALDRAVIDAVGAQPP